MSIIIKNIFSVSKDRPDKKNLYVKIHKRTVKNHRKNKNDRRDSIRNGIIVSLSTKHDRRVTRDRRKKIP